MSNNKVSTVNADYLNSIGNKELRTLEISSFFPYNHYPFSRDTTYRGMQYVRIIEKWIDKKIPIRIIITDGFLNMGMSIDEFTYSIEGGSKDVYYTLKLSEYRYPNLTTVKK